MQDSFFDDRPLSQIVEGIIFAHPKPISAEVIVTSINEVEPSITLKSEDIHTIVAKLNHEYSAHGRAFRIKQRAGGFTFATESFLHTWLQWIQHKNAQKKLSQSSLEALSIIAYKQPVTKPIVDAIRGVDSGYLVRQLLEKGLIQVCGRSDAPGRPLLYKTTDLFLEHFGLESVSDLPKPREVEEILNDDDMQEHRNTLLDLQPNRNQTQSHE